MVDTLILKVLFLSKCLCLLFLWANLYLILCFQSPAVKTLLHLLSFKMFVCSHLKICFSWVGLSVSMEMRWVTPCFLIAYFTESDPHSSVAYQLLLLQNWVSGARYIFINVPGAWGLRFSLWTNSAPFEFFNTFKGLLKGFRARSYLSFE